VTLAYDPKEDENILQQIRARVSSIPTSSPYLEAQKEAERALLAESANAEKAAKLAAMQAEAPLLAATAAEGEPAPEAATEPSAG
jgi:hypothetical protein